MYRCLYCGDIDPGHDCTASMECKAQIDQLNEAAQRYSVHIRALEGSLSWALGLIAMYDAELVRRGDPPEVVYSESHKRGMALAKDVLQGIAVPIRRFDGAPAKPGPTGEPNRVRPLEAPSPRSTDLAIDLAARRPR